MMWPTYTTRLHIVASKQAHHLRINAWSCSFSFYIQTLFAVMILCAQTMYYLQQDHFTFFSSNMFLFAIVLVMGNRLIKTEKGIVTLWWCSHKLSTIFKHISTISIIRKWEIQSKHEFTIQNFFCCLPPKTRQHTFRKSNNHTSLVTTKKWSG